MNHPDYLRDALMIAVLLFLGWLLGPVLGGLLGQRREQDTLPIDDAREIYRRLRERANR